MPLEMVLLDKLPDRGSALTVWPLPRNAVGSASDLMSMFISGGVRFKVNSESKLLQDAVERYTLFIAAGDDSKCVHKAVELNTINVVVSDDSEDLNSDRKYEVIINSKSQDITISASSPFGAM